MALILLRFRRFAAFETRAGGNAMRHQNTGVSPADQTDSVGRVRSSGGQVRFGPACPPAQFQEPASGADLRSAFRRREPAPDRGRTHQPRGPALSSGRAPCGTFDACRCQCRPPGRTLRGTVHGDGRARWPAGAAPHARMRSASSMQRAFGSPPGAATGQRRHPVPSR